MAASQMRTDFQRSQQSQRLVYLRKFRRRRKAFKRRPKHGVRLRGSAGGLVELGEGERRAQSEAARALPLSDSYGGFEGFLSGRRVGRSRFGSKNLPNVRALLRMGRAMVDPYCESFGKVPEQITLDIDDTFDAVHGGQQLRLFNAHYDEYGFQPIVVFDGEGRFITAVLRPAKRPGGKEIKAFLRRLVRAVRANWPNTEILLRADSHYCSPKVLDWCRANGLDYILGVAPTATLRRHIEVLEASTKARFEAAPRDDKIRRFKEFFDGAKSWSRVERIIARVEAGPEGPDTRFIVTNLNKRNARVLYEEVYCRRGQAENHIKSFKTHLAADRTSCTKATANQLRLFLHAGAYWLMWGLRVSMPKRSMWRVAQFDTLRLRLIKIAARVVEMKTMIRVHLPTSCPVQDILRFALGRIPRLVT